MLLKSVADYCIYTLSVIIVSSLLIPEPGILLHGILRDDSCLLGANNSLHWSFTPVGGGKTISLSCPIQAVEDSQNLFRYRVVVPLSTKIEGISSPEGTIQVSYELKAYRRELQVAGSDLVKTDTVYLSARDRGTFQLFSTTW